jgi:autotransporter translocation and assembly factor TamB
MGVPPSEEKRPGAAPGRAARTAALALLVTALALAAFVLRAPLTRAAVAAALDLATGYGVAFDDLDLRRDRATVRGLHLTRGGDPVLDVDRVALAYDLRGLVPGGSPRYGIESIRLVRPRLHFVRRADGSFAVAPAVAGGSAGPGAAGPAAAPLRFDARVVDGSIELVDPFRVLPETRRLRLTGLNGTLHYDDAARTAYRLGGEVAADAAQRFELVGRIDRSGYAVHRLRANDVDIVPLVDYFINTPSARFVAGRVRSLDVRAYAFGPVDGGTGYHLSGGGDLAGGAMAVPGLLPEATGMHGRVDLADEGIVTRRLQASLGPLAVRLAGGLYDWSAPSLRLGIEAEPAQLTNVRRLFAFSRTLPLAGRVRLATLVEGAAGNPVVATRVAATDASYAGIPVDELDGRAIYHSGAIQIVAARGVYGALAVDAGGSIDLGDVVHTQLAADVRGPAAGLPYAAQIAPGARIHASVLLNGDALRFDARGVVDGAGGGTSLAGVFHLDPSGDGEFGPFIARRDDGTSVAGAYYSRRSASESGFWLDAQEYAFALAPAGPHLPGLDLAPPPFSGRFRAAVAGEGPPSRFRLAGRIEATGVRAGDVSIDTVDGSVVGGFGDLRLGAVRARGPWGAFAGRGAYADGRLALDGQYQGSFAQLETFTGPLGASGSIDGPVALLLDPQRTVVQARGDATGGATVRGVALEGFSGTLGIERKRLRLYGGLAGVAGATLAAAGSFDGAAPGAIGVSVADADGNRLGVVSVGGGRVSAIGAVDAGTAAPRFIGGLALGAATIGAGAVTSNGDVTLQGSRLEVRDADASVGTAVGTLSGSVEGSGSAQPRYDVAVHVAAAQVAPILAALAPQRRDVVGTLAGDVRVRGTAGRYAVDGRLAVPEGAVNGLAFSDASAALALDPRGLRLQGGEVTVGTTHAGFGLLFGNGETALSVDAPHADLADFNDYFDAGDTLGGRGRIVGRFVQHRKRLETTGDIAIASLRYRRFDLGDARAVWTSRGPDVSGTIGFGGPSGHLVANGTVTFPAHVPLQRLFGGSRFRGEAHLRDLDLGVWLPALGYQFPVLGRVNADANVTGPLGNPVVVTEATLAGGSLGRFPVDSLTVSATSTVKGTTLRRASLELPALSVEGSGSFGLGARDPLMLALHAKSPNVGVFADRLFGANYPVTGLAEADVHVTGSRSKPQVAGGFDLENMVVRGVAVPQALGQFTVAGRDVVLSGVEVGFATGALYLAGSVPFEVAPFSFGPARSPITLDMSVKGLDLADFSTLLPAGSTLAGKLNGRVAVDGTAGAPQLNGSLALSDGALRTPVESAPLTALAAHLSFDGNDVKLDTFRASAGGGTVDASGSATIPDLVRPGTDAAYRLDARAASLRLDLPEFGSGTVDGTLALSHRPATLPKLAGRLTLNDATIPFSALLLAAGGAGGGFDAAPAAAAAASAGDLSLALDVSAERNVRVRSANVDIGARGDLRIDGTRDAPQLSGVFTSTGGTLTYFNTVFRLVDGTVTFAPDLGVIPNLAARATTHVINPDPNTVRNVSGTADISLSVTGPVTNLSIALSSDPNYDRQQILGLLLDAPALGAKNLFGDTPGTPTLFGSNEVGQLAPGVAANRNQSGEISVAQEAFGIANAQFTRTLLAPFESTVASAVGLTNLNVNVDYTGNVGLTARKILGKNVDAIYGTTFGYPYRQTFGFDVKAGPATAGQVTVFQTLGATGINSLTPTTYFYTTNPKLQATQPTAGTAGFSLSLQRLFW